jgi:hypothetical protein
MLAVNNIGNMFNTFVNNLVADISILLSNKENLCTFSPQTMLTTGIKTSCKRKKELYLLMKAYDDNNLKQYYK